MKRLADTSGLRLFVSSGLAACCMAAIFASLSYAGGFGGIRQNAVGGVMVDAQGVLRAATVENREAFLNEVRQRIDLPQGDLAEAAELRMVSLRGLQDAIRQARADGKPLPDDVRFLAGLTRVEYVLAFPERNDIVLAGPAEPWKIRDDGSVVGAISDQPTLHLEDLMIALQSVETARDGGISCSIEPTAEGRQRLNNLLRRVQLRPGQDPRQLEPAMRQAFGPQTIKLNGLPTDSRFARVMVAADFEMKRLAMHLTESPIRELPSYLELAKNQQQSASSNPRWWMACNYDALTRTEDRLTWRLNGPGVKTMTETDKIAAGGEVERSDRQDKTAGRWAELMTENYEQLARSQSVFGDLRNVIDLSVVATLIVQESLDERAACQLDALMGEENGVTLASYKTPAAVEPQCSFLRGAKGWTVTASGGVSVNSFEVVQHQQVDPSLSRLHGRAQEKATDRWWWNG
ncbi:MAG: DUF1598 domain-containing protein [Pirellulaceae bacterium]